MGESKNKPLKYSIQVFIWLKKLTIDEGKINIFKRQRNTRYKLYRFYTYISLSE